MSLVRAILLLKPLVVINRTHLITGILFYYLFLLTRLFSGIAFFGHYEYKDDSGYAWIQIESETYVTVDIILSVTLLASPIIPILGLCAVTVCKILLSIKKLVAISTLK